MSNINFKPNFQDWNGRYAVIPGNTTRFKNLHSGIVVEWISDGNYLVCHAINNNIHELAQAVSRAKVALGGTGYGAFMINEFGQVIVPASDGLKRCKLVGVIGGKILFQNPETKEAIDISSSTGLGCGDLWEKPYIGIPFTLSHNGMIYFKKTDSSGEECLYPSHQDSELITKLHRAKGNHSGGRFIVNPYGLVLTKKETNGDWLPVFVGHIRHEYWFPKESN